MTQIERTGDSCPFCATFSNKIVTPSPIYYVVRQQNSAVLQGVLTIPGTNHSVQKDKMSITTARMATKLKPKKPFDYGSYHWKSNIDYRTNPEEYKVGKGEQGVLLCEPYKSEIGQYWRFKTPEIAKDSSDTIMKMFLAYLKKDDFVGADMSRKYLQMGFTRARRCVDNFIESEARFTNWKGGRKYKNEEKTETFERGSGDPIKAESAKIFFEKWKQSEANKKYKKMKDEWKNKYG